jgi:hypothetical protein
LFGPFLWKLFKPAGAPDSLSADED